MSQITALVDFSDPAQPNAPRLRHAFGSPLQTLVAHTLDQVRPLLDAVQASSAQGLWCVGYLQYEAAPAFDAALAVHAADGPLAWFAVYDKPLPWPVAPTQTAQIDWQSFITRADFDAAMATLLQAIADGELYQVNLTAQMRGNFSGAPQALFAALQRAQPGGYAAFIDTGHTDNMQILSVSPELFFDWRDGQILARPMKGTARRGATETEDAALAAALRSSPKERAENVMIVDLLRNDVSRIAQPFSVKVPRLFHTEALPTVWQMTSDVSARTRAGCSLADVFAALFPCGSVTGAPKVQAMRKIKSLEPGARGVYCGAIGVVQPGGTATFNVPIRTVTLHGAQAQCGIGSGITFDASAEGEWQEWANKQAFVQRASAPFALLETLALVDGVLRNRAEHLARLAQAAAHFGTPWDAAHVAHTLDTLIAGHPEKSWRVRLLLDAQGHAAAEAYALEASPARVRLQLADRPLLEAHSEFVRFKTTRRGQYEAFTTPPGVFDTLLWNATGEITECTRGNIALLLDGRWVTPPLACGLLGGIGRAKALEDGRLVEALVRVDDLPRVQGLAFVNSLRGWIDADLV
ncbi:para-aminobenzoate synthetase / 4-amino-4-deoxychorismate lyase [Rhodoferax sp. OV413]|uniref:aminodeoxychorismate synthase component I n=1 Tax=Rhodoferax sp. OV413 TaxID=1855285 RepID=UPI00088EB111|nr:aminodeoxychorismate synthase component I [Rhodoferax sp. OV413]SDO86444.1 para-aminobenzoate synthetase / 4-amino-4-deoxychorismate lyase [Rhodoferax sp. OV413]